jgi:hypothetical protein
LPDISKETAHLNEAEEPKDQLPATTASAAVTADQRAPNVVRPSRIGLS